MSRLGDNVEVEADNSWTEGLGFNPPPPPDPPLWRLFLRCNSFGSNQETKTVEKLNPGIVSSDVIQTF